MQFTGKTVIKCHVVLDVLACLMWLAVLLLPVLPNLPEWFDWLPPVFFISCASILVISVPVVFTLHILRLRQESEIILREWSGYLTVSNSILVITWLFSLFIVGFNVFIAIYGVDLTHDVR